MSDEAAFARVLVPVPPMKPSARKRFAGMQARIPEAADLILLGDSLAAGWPGALVPLPFPEWQVLNLGLPGDRVGNTLWRLENLPARHLRPRVMLLLLGTNNLGDGDPADAITAGILAVLGRARDVWGGPKAILVTVPRRGLDPGFREAERSALNAALARRLESDTEVTILDADAALAEASGEAPSLLPDRLHLSEAGYARLGAALRPLLAEYG
jgi:lysophospholipase L1-like esterase